ncbi:2-C-methyl-D-erythritol 2,4-cyclodiphosphate synthase [Aliikangiella sp. IMCC44632]
MRVGHGYDVHAFGGTSPLILGGVKFPDHQGLVAHSDGDVLLHAVCDALLGAAALGDIGRHFPDTEKEFAGADSRVLLRHVIKLIQAKQYRVGNIDVTVVAQTPKMLDSIEAIRKVLMTDLQVSIEQVNVKATTTEKLGFVGRKEGIAVHCVALIESTADEYS